MIKKEKKTFNRPPEPELDGYDEIESHKFDEIHEEGSERWKDAWICKEESK